MHQKQPPAKTAVRIFCDSWALPAAAASSSNKVISQRMDYSFL
ncbi:hypothetical protein [Microbulbifer taiwanensis]